MASAGKNRTRHTASETPNTPSEPKCLAKAPSEAIAMLQEQQEETSNKQSELLTSPVQLVEGTRQGHVRVSVCVCFWLQGQQRVLYDPGTHTLATTTAAQMHSSGAIRCVHYGCTFKPVSLKMHTPAAHMNSSVQANMHTTAAQMRSSVHNINSWTFSFPGPAQLAMNSVLCGPGTHTNK